MAMERRERVRLQASSQNDVLWPSPTSTTVMPWYDGWKLGQRLPMRPRDVTLHAACLPCSCSRPPNLPRKKSRRASAADGEA
jgi:hypothetical protein